MAKMFKMMAFGVLLTALLAAATGEFELVSLPAELDCPERRGVRDRKEPRENYGHRELGLPGAGGLHGCSCMHAGMHYIP